MVWCGRRFKTPAYKQYEQDLLLLLPKKIDKIYLDQPMELFIDVGFSSRASDLDNCVKPFIDILQKKYSFNDKMIFKLYVCKNIVKKGREYIDFKIKNI